MQFYSAFNSLHAEDLPTSPGDRLAKMYEMRVNKEDGKSYVTAVGEFDLQDRINEANCGIELHDLIERFNNGDVSAIPDPSFDDIDISGAPRDMLEAHIRLEKSKLDFEQLPSEVKAYYDNDFGNFLQQVVAKKNYYKEPEPVKVETVAASAPAPSVKLEV